MGALCWFAMKNQKLYFEKIKEFKQNCENLTRNSANWENSFCKLKIFSKLAKTSANSSILFQKKVRNRVLFLIESTFQKLFSNGLWWRIQGAIPKDRN